MKKFLPITLFFLSACSSACTTSPIYKTETIKIKPSPLLLEPLPIPPFIGSTNEDLLLYTLTLEEKLQLCNARLHALEKWIKKD